MNTFRSKLLGGRSLKEPLLGTKAPRDLSSDGENDRLDRIVVPRSESRTADHRDEDRHRLSSEQATARWDSSEYPIELINLSGGGAMIAGPFRPRLWDRVELALGDCATLETAVRWLRDGRIGLEFAHETRIEADEATRNATLRAVIARSFPDVLVELVEEAPASPWPPEPELAPLPAPADTSRRREARHPLIWNGLIHFDHDSTPVRLRNISARGALVEGVVSFPVGAELLLDLDEAGSLFATVHWARGDQTGLRFETPFDLDRLARCRPEIAPAHWAKPDYLRDDSSESSPWAAQWGRLSISELHRTLKR